MPIKLYIATPTYSRDVTLDYMVSMRSLEKELIRNNIACDLQFIAGTVVSTARNGFASMFLQDETFTHLLFIDSDMYFRPQAVGKLLQSGKEFAGCICPARSFDPAAQHQAARQVDDRTLARNVAQKYVLLDQIHLKADESGLQGPVVDRGLVRTEKIGFGITLLQRSVLLKMRDRFPELLLNVSKSIAYQQMGLTSDILQVFDPLQDHDGAFISEDLAFCHRWIHGCGGEIWVCLDEEIGHVGQHRFEGRASDRLRYGSHPAR